MKSVSIRKVKAELRDRSGMEPPAVSTCVGVDEKIDGKFIDRLERGLSRSERPCRGMGATLCGFPSCRVRCDTCLDNEFD